jgi:hypothetical protein
LKTGIPTGPDFHSRHLLNLFFCCGKHGITPASSRYPKTENSRPYAAEYGQVQLRELPDLDGIHPYLLCTQHKADFVPESIFLHPYIFCLLTIG